MYVTHRQMMYIKIFFMSKKYIFLQGVFYEINWLSFF